MRLSHTINQAVLGTLSYGPARGTLDGLLAPEAYFAPRQPHIPPRGTGKHRKSTVSLRRKARNKAARRAAR